MSRTVESMRPARHRLVSTLTGCDCGRCGPDGARSSDLSLEKVGNCGFYKRVLNIKCREVRVWEREEMGVAINLWQG